MKVDRHVFRQWLCGIYSEYANPNDMFDFEKAKKAKRFSHEVLAFMDKHNVINPEIK